jgi:hypothetical protein
MSDLGDHEWLQMSLSISVHKQHNLSSRGLPRTVAILPFLEFPRSTACEADAVSPVNRVSHLTPVNQNLEDIEHVTVRIQLCCSAIKQTPSHLLRSVAAWTSNQ